MILFGAILLLNPQDGLHVVALVPSLALMLYGLEKLVYYIRMAHHMTGGLSLLFIAIIAFDVGVFAISVNNNPQLAVAIYLICYYILSGVLSIARAIESKLFASPWASSVVRGVVDIALALLCVSFINSGESIIWIFCLGLFYGAGVRLVSVFKPTEIIYIQ